jgi:TrbL/VirB6 plasmid conjugal transfer protein
MGVAFPIVTYFSLALIGKILLALFRAIFGYIYAIFGITFLIILSPIFVSFYLFKPTQQYFNKWLGYMVSMSVQVVLLFAFLTFILSLPISGMTSNLSPLIIYQSQAAETTAIRLPWRYCTLCDFKVVDKANHSRIMTPKDTDYIKQAELLCNTYPVDVPNTDSAGRKPITLTFAVAPKQADGQMNALLTFFGNGIMALIVLAIVVERMLTMLPMLAQRLAGGLGGSYAPQMGGGEGAHGLVAPGESLARDFGQGFGRGMRDNAYIWNSLNPREINVTRGRIGPGDGVSSAVVGIKQGIEGMVTGQYRGGALHDRDPDAQARAGFSWQRWISNPHDFGK